MDASSRKAEESALRVLRLIGGPMHIIDERRWRIECWASFLVLAFIAWLVALIAAKLG